MMLANMDNQKFFRDLLDEANETDVVSRVRQRMARDVPDANALMTQEQVQLLLAANALRRQSGDIHVSLNGQADAGNHVVCVDVDAGKIERLCRGEIPIHEPGLDALVKRNAKG